MRDEWSGRRKEYSILRYEYIESSGEARTSSLRRMVVSVLYARRGSVTANAGYETIVSSAESSSLLADSRGSIEPSTTCAKTHRVGGFRVGVGIIGIPSHRATLL